MVISASGDASAESEPPEDRTSRPAGLDRHEGLSESIFRIPIAMLRDADSPRLEGIDRGHVRSLVATDGKLPPIIVHRPTMKVVDGMHRLHVARLNDQREVEVRYFDGSEREAFLLAVELNMRHGLPLTLSDRKKSAMKILEGFPEWSDRAIGARTGLSGKTVGALRRRAAGRIAQAPVRVGRDGRSRPLHSDKSRRPGAGLPSDQVEGAPSDQLPGRTDSPARANLGVALLPVARARFAPQFVGDDGFAEDVQASGHGILPAVDALGSCTDPDMQLASLKRDPALKYSNDGREMIRWLETHIVRRTDMGLVLQAPAHQARKIATLARTCAAQWNCIAMRMELACDDVSPTSR
ncbi:ParB/RepB/Spo0J family partition protein [Streptomyces sp. NBC_01476]|uniref:ParB/RepB/Spo0J family partition protein n=1 Tax=Streptomyces sp. NBC_01476 TaxID=2903881 RepID=UPI002E2FA19E|nr:ParB/RepB/Spo0J family partition protein [Streptomyces sp. NBC_01476]